MHQFPLHLSRNVLKYIPLGIFIVTVLTMPSSAQHLPQDDRIQTKLDTTKAGELILRQSFTVDAPAELVWKYFTQADLYSTWAAPVAEINLKINGAIRANYRPDSTLADEGTITTHILNYIPERLLTLQAEIPADFPYFMKQYQEDFYNVIEFEETGDQQTTVTSYGMGYRNTEQFHDMISMFAKGNKASYNKLIKQIEGSSEK